MPATASDDLIPILEAAGRLKRVERAGWVRVGVANPESVADHSYRLALMAMLFGPRLGLNVEKMLRLALVHDLAEARLGDLTPAQGIPREEKQRREAIAFSEVVGDLPEGPALYDLWREYDAGATPEAQALRQLDKLELALQALEYERETGLDLDEFWNSARAALSDPLLRRAYARLRARRPRRVRSRRAGKRPANPAC